MNFKKFDILQKLIPSIWDLIILILILVNYDIQQPTVIPSKLNVLFYVNIAVFITLIIIEIIVNKKLTSKFRFSMFVVFEILALIYVFMKKITLFFSINALMVLIDFLIVIIYSVSTVYKNKHKTLSPNQFSLSRKILSLSFNILVPVLIFFVSFIIFYFKEPTPLYIIIIVIISYILFMLSTILVEEIRFRPMTKYEKKFKKDFDFDFLKEKFEILFEDKLHPETINMLNMLLLNNASHKDISLAKDYINKVKEPTYKPNKKIYYEAIFYYNYFNNDKEELLKNKTIILKNVKDKVKKRISYLYSEIEGNNKKNYKWPKNISIYDKRELEFLSNYKRVENE